ncbi:MAG: primary-amine oxidase [Gammaproteobacteria bacterium]
MQENNKHPLDMLNRSEIESAVTILKKDNPKHENSSFSYIVLEEPEKETLRSLSLTEELERKVKIVGVDENSEGFEAEIDLVEKKLLDLSKISNDAGPTYTLAEIYSAIQLTLEDSDYQKALEKRGITDLSLIHIDPWPGGGFVNKNIKKGNRALKAISFLKDSPKDNAYARPIQGLIAHIDLTEKKVVEIEDHGLVDVPKTHARYDADGQENLRDNPKEISITQPEGTGFSVQGNQVSWEGWKTRVSIDPIEGLVLHELSLNDRPIFFRAGMSDMVVPYGSSDPMHSWKAVHDGTEFAFGTMANSLTLGCDCLGEIYYFDTHKLTFDGSVETIENAICLHEEDFGIQWKHTDATMMGYNEVRRSRRLVISSLSTIGNYDYGIFWYLYLDGTVQLEIKLTGIIGISAYHQDIHKQGQDFKITDELASPIHQHLFNMRIDWDLDGGANQLFETNVEALPIGEENPHGTQFKAVATHLTKEGDAKRDISPEKSRTWKIINPNKLNKVGAPTAYKVLLGNTPTLLSHSDSPAGKRASFAKHNLWGTPFKSEERSGGGRHTVMHSGEGGLDEMTASDRDISECDLVTWHTFGVTHVPRPEDWPVMPVEYCGFHLIPVGFFDQNPTINLPPACSKKSKSNKS